VRVDLHLQHRQKRVLVKTKVKKNKQAGKTQIIIGPLKLTRFERARIVGARAMQISMGAPVLLDVDIKETSPISIALMELREKVLPISIRRSLPDGTSQNIPLKLLAADEDW
jgi:DNA-directed RNA polymerase I, II, and III subunit RPABC2